MRARVLLALIAVLVVAGVAVAASAVFYWLPPGHGQYTGPGIPYSAQSSCTLRGEGSWCSYGFQVNSTDFNVTECFSTNSTFPTAVWVEFMNLTQYDEFNVNSTLSHIGNQTVPGCWGPKSLDVGPGPFWFAYLDTLPTPVKVQFTISVEIPT